MGIIVVEPIKIGDEVRQPGYRLTENDMKGRNLGSMRRQGVIKHVDDDELAKSAAPKRSRAAKHVDDDE